MEDWPEFFAGTPLLTTQVNHNDHVSGSFTNYRDFPPGGPWAPNVGLFIFPKLSFAICVIPKVGSSMWMDVLLKMVKDDPSAKGKFEWTKYSNDWRGTAAQKAALFSDSSTTRAVFVREPLSRFASAFLDKCYSERVSLSTCPMKEKADAENTSLTMSVAVNWMMQANLLTLNEHWLPQAYFCQLKSRILQYSIVGRYSQNSYGDDATCVMEDAGLDRYNSKGPDHNNTAYWTTSDTSANAPPNNYHTNTDAEENAMLQRLFTPDAARKLIALLHMDYETFNFPKEPAWVPQATGSLYNKGLPPSREVF